MSRPLAPAAGGLVLVGVGTVIMLFVWLVFVASALAVRSWFYDSRYVLLAVLAVGLVIAFVGRCLCHALLPDPRAARAWAVLAMVLDGCGLLSGVTTFVIAQAGVGVGPVVGISASLFSLGGLILGRVAFPFYLRAVAKYVDDPPLAGRAVWVFVHAVAVTGGAVLSGWFLGYGGASPEVFQVWLVLVTLAILHWAWRYVRLLNAVGSAARVYTPPPLDDADDPDREYRERYEQAQGDGRVSATDEG